MEGADASPRQRAAIESYATARSLRSPQSCRLPFLHSSQKDGDDPSRCQSSIAVRGWPGAACHLAVAGAQWVRSCYYAGRRERMPAARRKGALPVGALTSLGRLFASSVGPFPAATGRSHHHRPALNGTARQPGDVRDGSETTPSALEKTRGED
jgi:hypothetical protein